MYYTIPDIFQTIDAANLLTIPPTNIINFLAEAAHQEIFKISPARKVLSIRHMRGSGTSLYNHNTFTVNDVIPQMFKSPHPAALEGYLENVYKDLLAFCAKQEVQEFIEPLYHYNKQQEKETIPIKSIAYSYLFNSI